MVLTGTGISWPEAIMAFLLLAREDSRTRDHLKIAGRMQHLNDRDERVSGGEINIRSARGSVREPPEIKQIRGVQDSAINSAIAGDHIAVVI